MNPLQPSTSRAPARRFTAFTFSGLVLALSAFLLTACPQAAPPSPDVTPTPSPTPAATPTGTPLPPAPRYSGTQQMEYMATAKDGFMAARQAKSQGFVDAHNEFDAAGGLNPKGLTSKDAIAARRAILAKCIAGNEDYITFVKGQVDTYHAELAKTPLLPADVDAIADDYASKANTPGIIQLRETVRDALKCSDDMLASLEKSYGDWLVSDAGRLTFKKKSDVAAYSALSQKYNKLAADEVRLRDAVNGTSSQVPSASAPPTANAAASVSPGPTASPAASASPAH